MVFPLLTRAAQFTKRVAFASHTEQVSNSRNLLCARHIRTCDFFESVTKRVASGEGFSHRCGTRDAVRAPTEGQDGCIVRSWVNTDACRPDQMKKPRSPRLFSSHRAGEQENRGTGDTALPQAGEPVASCPAEPLDFPHWEWK